MCSQTIKKKIYNVYNNFLHLLLCLGALSITTTATLKYKNYIYDWNLIILSSLITCISIFLIIIQFTIKTNNQIKNIKLNTIKTDKPADRQKLAAKIVGTFLKTKLRKKPGEGGYIVNVLVRDVFDIHFHKVDFKKMALSYANLKTGFAVGSGEIQITKANAIFK